MKLTISEMANYLDWWAYCNAAEKVRKAKTLSLKRVTNELYELIIDGKNYWEPGHSLPLVIEKQSYNDFNAGLYAKEAI